MDQETVKSPQLRMHCRQSYMFLAPPAPGQPYRWAGRRHIPGDHANTGSDFDIHTENIVGHTHPCGAGELDAETY